MPKPPTFRPSTTFAVLAFVGIAVSGGISSPSSSSGRLSSADAVALAQRDLSPGVAVVEAAHHCRHHHGPLSQCTCHGPCDGGATPTPNEPRPPETTPGEIDGVRIVTAKVPLIPRATASYLLPLPNAPPQHG